MVANQSVRLQQVAKSTVAHHMGWSRPFMNLEKHRPRLPLRRC